MTQQPKPEPARIGDPVNADELPARGVPRNVVALHQGAAIGREWYARIRVREDRLARLWVSNVANHDIVVWSNREKRWVALLAVPELRRALEKAARRLPKGTAGPLIRALRTPTKQLSTLPNSLPPAPPLALLDAATRGIGELRLRSIAQGEDPSTGRAWATDDRGRAASPILLLQPTVNPPPPRQPPSRLRPPPEPRRAMARWCWSAFERVLWIGVGVLAALGLSSVSHHGQSQERVEPAASALPDEIGDSTDPDTTLARGLLGPNHQCLAHPVHRQTVPSH